MKILLSWLKEYLPEIDPCQLPDVLTRAGIEVDHIEEVRPQFTGVIAARIKSVQAHPHCPELVCATVFDGKSEHTVVCGATNCREGMMTAYAPINAIVNQKKIEGISFGDVRSDGMLCSELELALSEFHEGIMDLPHTLKEGTQLERYFTDTIYEVSITPNLGHCQSIMGVARELSAFLGTPIRKKPWLEKLHLEQKHAPALKVTVVDSTICPRYSALMLEEVTVGPSSSLIRIRLEQTGHRSINNIVDITNYVSHDIGQPLHAFDADRVHKGHLIVREAEGQEHMTFLDEVTRLLPKGTIVIADSDQILAAGGIMGGESSAVTANTRRVILESAYFNPGAIRRARTKLMISNDSSKRFERGADRNLTLKALENAYHMLHERCPKVQIVALDDVASSFQQRRVACRLSRACLLLGYDVSANEAEGAFQRLELPFTFDGQDSYQVVVPSFRHDLVEEVDLIEEIGRINGLQRESKTPARFAVSTLPHHPLYLFEGEVRRRLLSFGLQEAITSDLISPSMAHLMTDHTITDDALVKMLNPLSSEQSVLRPSLMPSLLEVAKRNINQRESDLHFFEVGHVHLKKGESYVEPRVFAIMLTGAALPAHFSRQPRTIDFFDLKGILEELFSTLRFSNVSLKKSEMAILHPGRQAKIFVGGVHVGIIGEIHPKVLQTFDIEQPILFAECDMQELMRLARAPIKMQPMAQFPSSERDWTLTLPKTVSFAAIMTKINESKPSLCESVTLSCLFEHEKLGEGNQNVTLHFVYRDREKTISQEEVERAHQALCSTTMHYLAEKYPGVQYT